MCASVCGPGAGPTPAPGAAVHAARRRQATRGPETRPGRGSPTPRPTTTERKHKSARGPGPPAPSTRPLFVCRFRFVSTRAHTLHMSRGRSTIQCTGATGHALDVTRESGTTRARLDPRAIANPTVSLAPPDQASADDASALSVFREVVELVLVRVRVRVRVRPRVRGRARARVRVRVTVRVRVRVRVRSRRARPPRSPTGPPAARRLPRQRRRWLGLG